MTLPHQNATASITIDGLAVCCFNKAGNKWEVGYLRHPMEPKHQLILEVENETAVEILEDVREITFSATNPQTIPGTANGFFDPGGPRPNRHSFPTTADEIEDYRWIVNLQDPRDINHGNATLKRADCPVTRAFMHNAVFYSSKLAVRPVYRIPFTNMAQHDPNQMTEATRQQFIFGRTNNEVTADIYCAPDTGKVTLTIGGQSRDFAHRSNNPWKIRLTNICPRTGGDGPRFELGDFHLFYSVLNVTGQKQAIWGEPLIGHGPIPLDTGRVDCDLTWAGASEKLDDIIP